MLSRQSISFWDAGAAAHAWRMPVPLAPGPEDLDEFARRIHGLACGPQPRRVLLLGTTPAIASMSWPVGTRLVALDWSSEVIRRCWSACHAPEGAQSVCADWREMPVASHSFDAALADGCLTALGGMRDAGLVVAELHRVLRRGALLALRNFVRPDKPERIEDVFEQCLGGANPDMEVFRFRLAMAMHGSEGQGVVLDDVWQAMCARIPEVRTLRESERWPADMISRWSRWRGVRMRFFFPTLGELTALLESGFELLECSFPGYVMGERCPRLILHSL